MQTIGIYIIVEVIKIPQEYGALISTLVSIPFTYIIMRIILKDKK
jgi:hypothetical protein